MDEEIKYTTSNLLEFDSVMDIDRAVIKFAIANFNNPKYYRNIVVNATKNELSNLIVFREKKNPLTVLLKSQYEDSADDLYEEIMKKHKTEIYNSIEPTDIFRYVKTLEETGGVITSTISCKNEQEEQLIKKLHPNIRTVINQTDMTGYTCLFIKDVDELPKYKNFRGQYLFVCNYRFNTTIQFKLKPIVFLAFNNCNIIRLIDPYVGITIPVDKGE